MRTLRAMRDDPVSSKCLQIGLRTALLASACTQHEVRPLLRASAHRIISRSCNYHIISSACRPGPGSFRIPV
jgi:hypothetical protein